MKRKVLIGFATLLALLGIGLALAWFNLDRIVASLKPRIEAIASEALGKPVRIGQVDVKVFPRAAITLSSVELGGPETKDFLLHQAELQLELIPLLSRNIKINKLTLSKPHAKLKGDPISASQASEASAAPHSAQSNSRNQDAGLTLAIEKIEIRDGSIEYEKSDTNEKFVLSGLSLDSNVNWENNFPTLVSPILEAQFQGTSAKLSAKRISFIPNRLELDGGEIDVLGNILKVNGNYDLNQKIGGVSLDSDKISVESLIPLIKSKLPLLLEYQVDANLAPALNLTLKDQTWKVEGQVKVSQGSAAVSGARIDHANADIAISASSKSTTMKIRSFDALLDGNSEQIQVAGTISVSPFAYDLVGSSGPLDLRALAPLLAKLAPQTAPMDLAGKAKPEFHIQSSVAKSPQIEAKIELSGVSAKIEGHPLSNIHGSVSIESTSGIVNVNSNGITFSNSYSPEPTKVILSLKVNPLQGKASISAENFDLEKISNSFLPQLAEYKISGMASGQTDLEFKAGSQIPEVTGKVKIENGHANAPGFPIKDLSGELSFVNSKEGATVDASSLQLQLNGKNVTSTFKATLRDSMLTVHDVLINGFSGTLAARGRVGFAPDSDFSVSYKLQGISITELEALLPMLRSLKFSGTIASAVGDLRGNLGRSLIPSLSGKSAISLVDGKIQGMNLGRMVLEKVDQLPMIKGDLYDYVPEEYEEAFEDEDTKFSSINAKLNFVGANVNIVDAKLISQLFDITARGTFDFDLKLDIETQFAYEANLSRAMARGVGQLKRVLKVGGQMVFPVTVGGTAKDPEVKPDVSRLVEAAITNTAEDLLRDIFRDRR